MSLAIATERTPVTAAARLEEALWVIFDMYGRAADDRDTALMGALFPIITQLSPRDVRRVREHLASLDVTGLQAAARAMRECA